MMLLTTSPSHRCHPMPTAALPWAGHAGTPLSSECWGAPTTARILGCRLAKSPSLPPAAVLKIRDLTRMKHSAFVNSLLWGFR